MSNLMKILPVGAEFFHEDRQTDTANLLVAFHNFANAHKSCNQNETPIKSPI